MTCVIMTYLKVNSWNAGVILSLVCSDGLIFTYSVSTVAASITYCEKCFLLQSLEFPLCLSQVTQGK